MHYHEVLDAGTYLMKITSDNMIKYNLKCKVDKYGSGENVGVEPNDTFDKAQKITEKQVVSGVLSNQDVVDIYEFTLDKRQQFTLYKNVLIYREPAIGYMSPLEIKLYNNGKMLNDNKFKCWEDVYLNSERDGWDESTTYVLNAGTYYLTLNYQDMMYRDIYEFMYELCDPEPSFTDSFGNRYVDGKSIEQDGIDLESGEEFSLKVKDGKVKKWKSLNPKIAKVNKTGRVTTLKSGDAKIVAILKNGEKISIRISVMNSPMLSFDGDYVTDITVKKGKSKELYISGRAYDIDNVYTNTKIAKITSKKNATMIKVKGLKIGTTTLKIKVNGVKKLKLRVNVK
jgi:hypothetical protein